MRYYWFICILFFTITVTAQDTELSLIGWQDGQIVSWATIDAEPDPLYETTVPRIPKSYMVSPNGRYVIYGISDDDLIEAFPIVYDPSGYMLYDLATGEETILIESDTDLFSFNVTWSPDSSQIAWVHLVEDNIILELYDMATQQITILSDTYHGGYRDGGAGVLVPMAPQQWVGDYLVQESSGWSSAIGGIADVILMYHTQSDEILVFEFDDHYLFGMPTAIIMATDPTGTLIRTYMSPFIWYDDIIEYGDPSIYNLLPTPQLRTNYESDYSMTFMPYIARGGYVHWLVRSPNGNIFETGIVTLSDINVFPTPDGQGLLHQPVIDYREASYLTLWHNTLNIDTMPQLENIVPFWQTANWVIPDCDRPKFIFPNDIVPLIPTTLFALPDATSEMMVEVQLDSDIYLTEGTVCIDGVNWRQIGVIIEGDDIFGWIPESVDGNPTLQLIDDKE